MLKRHLLAAAMLVVTFGAAPFASLSATPNFDTVLYGVSYYDEYSPYERLDQDVAMMKAAGITVIRIGESTWGTMEPSEGKYDFRHIDRVLRAMEKAHIKVIIGTPTYAVPTWMARKYPAVLVTTASGQVKYGIRQNIDILNPDFRRCAEKTVRALVAHVKDSPAVIGFQVDNETKSYGNVGPYAQAEFRSRIRKQWGSLDRLNEAWGLNYWSNRINSWDDFPDVTGSINASLSGAYAEFQRSLVTEYLAWEAGVVRSGARPDQFVTQNFDMEGGGIQSQVDQFAAAKSLDVAGIDIYHGSEDSLDGSDIAFGNDLARSMKQGRNHLVLETEAQGLADWLPYPGQLRLQAFSHFASGANMVSYWHWGTTANGWETGWRGLLSQDYSPNPTYQEAVTIGADIKRIGPEIVNLKKSNDVAVYFSNRALTAFEAFHFGWGTSTSYNQILRPFYNALYRMNVEADLVDPSVQDLSKYKLIIVPCLYAVSDLEIARLNAFVKAGGHVVYTFKSGYSDENVKVRSSVQPGGFAKAVGATYSQYTAPARVSLAGNPFDVSSDDNQVKWFMELLTPTTATVLAKYDHPVWGKYAAITRNEYGSGEVTYIGFMPSDAVIEQILAQAVKRAGVSSPAQASHFPIIVRGGKNAKGKAIHYLFNYSAKAGQADYEFGPGVDLLSGERVGPGKTDLAPWGVKIIEEN